MGFKSRNIFNPFAKTDREVRKMADNIFKGLFFGGVLGASALKRTISTNNANYDRIAKAEMARTAKESEEQRMLDRFIEKCKQNNDSQIVDKIKERLVNTSISYYTSPSSPNLFYALQKILEHKISTLKSDRVKKECEISIEVLQLLREHKDVESVISHIKTKYPTSNDVKYVNITQQYEIIKKANQSDERQLLDAYTNKSPTELGIEYMIVFKTSTRLLNALTEYYKSPSSSNLFDALQNILEDKIALAKRQSIKDECSAAIEVLHLLRAGDSVDDVIEQMRLNYPTPKI